MWGRGAGGYGGSSRRQAAAAAKLVSMLGRPLTRTGLHVWHPSSLGTAARSPCVALALERHATCGLPHLGRNGGPKLDARLPGERNRYAAAASSRWGSPTSAGVLELACTRVLKVPRALHCMPRGSDTEERPAWGARCCGPAAARAVRAFASLAPPTKKCPPTHRSTSAALQHRGASTGGAEADAASEQVWPLPRRQHLGLDDLPPIRE